MKTKLSYSHCVVQVTGTDFPCPLCNVLVKDGTRHECKKEKQPLKVVAKRRASL